MKLGLIVGLTDDAAAAIRKVASLGLPTCQVSVWDVAQATEANARRLREAATSECIEITSIWAGWPGRKVWNFVDGPTTIGIVPPATRAERVAALQRGAEFAALLGVPSITTHVGFIPENPADPEYPGVVEAIAQIARRCRDQGLEFWFETGQETPITLLRAIEDVGTGNLGVNLDPANLLMYGKANPLDALDLLGRHVRGVHAKDGEYPTNPRELGVEKPLGEGRVNYPAFLARLRALDYAGALTIEREISGPRQLDDVRRAIERLESWT